MRPWPLTTTSPPAAFCWLLLLLAAAAVWEPGLQHQLAEGESYSETVSWAKVRLLLKVPSNWLIITQVGGAGG
jgi:hypothetical protein